MTNFSYPAVLVDHSGLLLVPTWEYQWPVDKQLSLVITRHKSVHIKASEDYTMAQKCSDIV